MSASCSQDTDDADNEKSRGYPACDNSGQVAPAIRGCAIASPHRDESERDRAGEAPEMERSCGFAFSAHDQSNQIRFNHYLRNAQKAFSLPKKNVATAPTTTPQMRLPVHADSNF